MKTATQCQLNISMSKLNGYNILNPRVVRCRSYVANKSFINLYRIINVNRDSYNSNRNIHGVLFSRYN